MLQCPIRKPFGPGVLSTVRPRMASWISAGLVNWGSLARVKYALSVSLTSITYGSDGSFTGCNWVSRLLASASDSSASKRSILPGATRGGDGVGTHITRLHIYHSYRFSEFQRCAALVISLLVQLAGHRPLLAVDLSFQSGVPSDLSLPP